MNRIRVSDDLLDRYLSSSLPENTATTTKPIVKISASDIHEINKRIEADIRINETERNRSMEAASRFYVGNR